MKIVTFNAVRVLEEGKSKLYYVPEYGQLLSKDRANISRELDCYLDSQGMIGAEFVTDAMFWVSVIGYAVTTINFFKFK